MRGMGRLRRAANRLRPKTLVLLYHRVNRVPLDPQLLCVTPEHFVEHLAVIRRAYRTVALPDLLAGLGGRLWRDRQVVLTFDDGYADNLDAAQPLLAQQEVPATVFVTAGMLDSDREYWWDELERIFLATPDLPPRLSLALEGQEHTWDLPAAAADAPGWNVLLPGPRSARQVVYAELMSLLRPLSPAARGTALAELFAWAGLSRAARPGQRALSSTELRQLEAGCLVAAGAHTLTHSVLASLPLPQQWAEITAGKTVLEACLAHPVPAFSYPFGGRGDYTLETVRLVREAGFACACANFPAPVMWGVDHFQLPRFLVRDWDGPEFARRLEVWFAG